MVKENVKKFRNRITTLFLFGVLFLVFALIITGFFIGKISNITKDENNKWDASVYYPLKNDDIETKETSIVESIFSKIELYENIVENYATSSFYFRMPFVLVKKACDKALGLDMTTSLCAGKNDLSDSGDLVLIYKDDYLCFVLDDADISEPLENLIAFGSQMENEERNFLLCMYPEKLRGNEIYQDHYEENQKEIINAFGACGLDLLCISDMVGEEKKESLFFKTDHHWLPSSGIWADKLLCEFMNRQYGYSFDTDMFNMDNYEIDIQEKSFLGSQGKKVTEVYSKEEDFPIILPLYDTELQVFQSKNGEMCYGTIEDTLLNYSAFNIKSKYSRNNHDFYGHGDQALITVHNNNIHDGSNVLIIKMSFANSMYPYLAAVVEDLNIIDLRHFDGSLQSFIRETDPDTVIVIYGVRAFNSKKAFDFR